MNDGGCACGAVRYRLTTAPLFVHCCHCTTCQTETGSAFVINALIETDRVRLSRGAPSAVLTPSDSGKGQTVMRCPTCHVALWSHYAGMGPRFAFVRVGTLDAPARVAPDIHIYTRSKLPWVVLPDNVPAVEEYYSRSHQWPADSLARHAAVLARDAPPR